jgi:cytidyltransferase-like protein
MKSFLELIEESNKTHNPVVMAFGRMNPPTTGHLKLIDKVRSEAEKRHAKHVIVVSHSQDSKKNPLSSVQKIKHLRRYSPKTNFEPASPEFPTILHHAAKLHSKGHDHLTVVAGSDRVKEYQKLLNDYNGKKGKHGYYNFKKIEVVSAGHRDPDAEGAEGMSGTKMRDHAKHGNFSAFREGVPHHVSDAHAKELMNDVRKGMGLNEEHNRGMFKAIFITGGPNSGKDVIIREAIASSSIVELNLIQAKEYLSDKQKLSEKSNDYRRESIRNRGPLIINGPADDNEKITYIKEELEELGYETMMVFVNTTDEASRVRNSMLSRMMVESVRHDKWLKAQNVTRQYQELYSNFMVFDNTGDLNDKEFDIHEIYESTNNFLDSKIVNETATDWMHRNKKLDINYTINRLFGEQNDKKTNRFLKIKTSPGFKADGPADTIPDARAKQSDDHISGNQKPRKDPNGRGHSGGAWSGVYSTENIRVGSSQPTIKVRPEPKESNFSQDNDKKKKLKKGDTSGKEVKKPVVDGIGSEWNTRTNGTGLTGGAGLGNQTYSESELYSNANPATTAVPSGGSVNPLTNAYDEKPKPVKYGKKRLREFQGFINGPESGVGGTLGGASNKEPMETYGDKDRNGILITKKKKKLKEDHVKELEGGLMKLTSHSYNSIDRLMQMIAKKHGITGKDLHDDFKDKHGKIPDAWIKEIK